MTHDQTLSLTFDNQKQTVDCENNTLKIAQQGIAFTIIDNVKQFDYEKLIPPRRRKREVNIELRQSETKILKLQIFNVSTGKVVTGTVHPFIRFNDTETRQLYVLKVNFYNKVTGQYIDKIYMPESKLQYKMYTMHLGFLHQKTYGPVFTTIKLENHVVCSFVILQVQYATQRDRIRIRRQAEQTPDSQISGSFLAAQLQATIQFTKTTIRYTYLHALHSTCNAMNNMLRLTHAAMTEHPTIAARQLLNVSTIHARTSGELMQVWPCATVSDVQVIPMPTDICSSRVPIRYTFARKTHTGFLDTIDNIIYATPKTTDCNLADNIPIWWDNQHQLYRRNGTLTTIQTFTRLQLTPYSDSDLQLTTAQPIFRQLMLYNYSEFPQLAMKDYMDTIHKQSVILNKLGLVGSTIDNTRTFSTNVVAQGLFSFLSGGIPSFCQIWVFTVCLTVSVTIAFKIVMYCCIKPGIKKNETRYKQFAIMVGQSRIGQRIKRKRRKQKQSEVEVELQTQAVQTETEPEAGPPCYTDTNVRTYQTIYPFLPTTYVTAGPRKETTQQAHGSREINYHPLYMAGINSNTQIQTCIPISVQNKVYTAALWDTGAELSIISGKICKELGITSDIRQSKIKAISVCKRNINFTGQVSVKFKIGNNDFIHMLHLWNDSPFEFLFGTDFMTTCGPVAIDHKTKLFWFDQPCSRPIPLIDGQRRFKNIPVALIKGEVIPARSMCCVQVESTCQVTISKEDAKFTGNEGIQTKKRITLPNVISTLNDSKLYIAVANWSNTPEKLYANTVMGTVEKLYDNPDIAVITDHTIPESDDNAPVGNAEAQFDTIAQAPEPREETKDTTWYDDIKWDEMNLTTGQKVALLVLLIQFMAVFAMNPTDIGLTRLLKHDIDIGNAKPIWQPQYRIPHAYRSLVAQQMDRLKAAGVITESHSPWNSPLVVVRKKTPDNSI